MTGTGRVLGSVYLRMAAAGGTKAVSLQVAPLYLFRLPTEWYRISGARSDG